MKIHCATHVCVVTLITCCAIAGAADRVWYNAVKISPRQHGSLRAHCFYNATSVVDVLTSPIALSVAGYSYVFNETNDIKDTFYWKKESKIRWKYYKLVEYSGSVKMQLNLRQQSADFTFKNVNLLILNVTNRTGYHPVTLTIGDIKTVETPYFVNWNRGGWRPYANDLLYVRGATMRYNSPGADRIVMNGICKYNAYTNLPGTVVAHVLIEGEGQVSGNMLPLDIPLQLSRVGPDRFVQKGPDSSAAFNFKNGRFNLRRVRTTFDTGLADTQTNFNFSVTITIGDGDGSFNENVGFRAKDVRNRMIIY